MLCFLPCYVFFHVMWYKSTVETMKLNKDNVMFSSMLCDIKVKNKKLNKDDCYVFFNVMWYKSRDYETKSRGTW